jgi:hypothetical protein
MARTLALLIAGAAVVFAAGCGDDDDDDGAGTTSGESEVASTTTGSTSSGTAASADAQAYVDAMIESFDNADPDELQIDREQAQCLAPRWVEVMGPDRLAEAGIQPEDFAAEGDVDLSAVGLTEDDGNELYDAFAACDIDVKTLFVDGFTSGRGISAEDRECFADALDDDLLRRIMVTTLVEGEEALSQDEELSGDLFSVFAECPGIVPTSDD